MDSFSAVEYSRPRRPNPDTVQYLCSLPMDLKAAEEELEATKQQQQQQQQQQQDPQNKAESEAEEEPQMIAAAKAAIEEIQNEIASLAGEERTSKQIELLAKIACEKRLGNDQISARRLLHGLSGYYLHLSCHRYGSHVTQTVLSVCGSPRFLNKETPASNTDTELTQEIDSSIPPVQDLVLNAAKELLPHARQLAKHVCGSHVIRALVCTLAGVNDVSNNNNNSLGNKKRKTKTAFNESTREQHANSTCIEIQYQVPQEYLQALISVADAIITGHASNTAKSNTDPNTTTADTEALTLFCHPSSGPLIALLVRVLAALSSATADTTANSLRACPPTPADFRLGIIPDESKFLPNSDADTLVQYMLLWQNSTKCGDILYGLSGETHGSRVLETVFSTAYDSMYQDLLERGDFLGKTLSEYATHDVSNFVVQTILRTVRTREQVEKLVQELTPLIRDGSLLQPNRRGVVWRAVEMSANWNIGQDSLLKAISEGCGSLRRSKGVDNREQHSDKKKMSSIAIKECINDLLSLNIQEGGRMTLDVNSARTIYNLLRFAPTLSGGVLDGIMTLSDNELVMIAKDGLGSRW